MQQAQDFIKKAFEDFSIEMFDKEACVSWILKKLHPDGAHCPKCGETITSQQSLQNFWSLRRVFCKHCKKIFTALTDTMLNGIQMDLRTFLLMGAFLGVKVDHKKIASLLKIHPETVRIWKSKFEAIEKMAEGRK